MTDNLKTWLTWRLEDVVTERKGDLAAMVAGGAGFDEGVRYGEEHALRDCLAMLREWERQNVRS